MTLYYEPTASRPLYLVLELFVGGNVLQTQLAVLVHLRQEDEVTT